MNVKMAVPAIAIHSGQTGICFLFLTSVVIPEEQEPPSAYQIAPKQELDCSNTTEFFNQLKFPRGQINFHRNVPFIRLVYSI